MSETTTQKPTVAAAVENMATTAASAVLNAPPGSEPSWAKPAVSILAMVVFVILIAVAYITHDAQSQAILSGVGAGMATQVLNYYLGSSSGSAAKTAMLAAAPPIVTKP